MGKVLITGAGGLIGSRLTEILLKQGYEVNCLSRKTDISLLKLNAQNNFTWNVKRGELDERAFEEVDTIIRLSGAGIAGKKWSTAPAVRSLKPGLRAANSGRHICQRSATFNR